MKWQGRRQSGNVEDRRGMSTGTKVVAGGGALGVIILLLQFFGGETGQTIAPILEQMNQNQVQTTGQTQELTAEQQQLGAFAATVLADTEDVWDKVFAENNLGTYEKPKLVLFTDVVQSGCGTASASSVRFIALPTISCIWI